MNEPPSVPAAPVFKDRHAGLVVFGVLELLLGCVCALLAPLMLVAASMSSQGGGMPLDARMMLQNVMFYALLAIVFIWLGVGSILSRRWARALLLILSWSWFVVGVLALVFLAVLLPEMLSAMFAQNPGMPEAAKAAVFIVPLVLVGVFFVVVPGTMVLFYRSKQVKATCEARDPRTRWTDACPLPVLAVSLWLAFGAISVLPMAAAYHGVAPFFGRFISGLPGTLVLLAFCAVWSYCAWAFYRLRLAGWWILVLTLGLLGISSMVTFARVDIIEMYRLMGYPEQLIQQIQQFNFFKGSTLVLWSSFCFIPLFGYLIYVKKFFRPAAPPAAQPPAQ
jgi:hypothetical protein